MKSLRPSIKDDPRLDLFSDSKDYRLEREKTPSKTEGQSSRPTRDNSSVRGGQSEEKVDELKKYERTSQLASASQAGYANTQMLDLEKLPRPWLVYEDGCYFGMTHSGHPHGQGLFWFVTGDIYIGNWSNGLPDSHGYLYFSEGGFYFGKINKGFANGPGLLVNSQTNFYYQGNFDSGMLDGRGIVIESGLSYDCYLKNDKIVHKATRPSNIKKKVSLPTKLSGFEEELELLTLLLNPESKSEAKASQTEWTTVYYGERNKDGKKHGIGTTISSNGSRYQGTYVEDKIQGFGITVSDQNNVTWGLNTLYGCHMFGSSITSADTYVGCFDRGAFSGPAFYYTADHDNRLIGNFSRGEITSKSYFCKGRLQQASVSIGLDLMKVMLLKAFGGGLKETGKSIGVTILAGRMNSIDLGERRDKVRLSTENAQFRKLLLEYINGSAGVAKQTFAGSVWEKRSKSPFGTTHSLRDSALQPWHQTRK